MATAVFTGSAAPGVAGTGRPCAGFVQYAVNQAAWWVFTLASTNQIAAKYSTDGTTWLTPSGSPLTLSYAHGGDARNFAFGYANISGYDVLYVATNYHANGLPGCIRTTLGTTWGIGSETMLEYGGYAQTYPALAAVMLDSSNYAIVMSSYSTTAAQIYTATHADSGSAWTAGFGAATTGIMDAQQFAASGAIANLGSRNLLTTSDNSYPSYYNFTDVNWNSWNGSSWSQGTGYPDASVLGTSVTNTDDDNWGQVARTTSDIHAIALSNNSNTFLHRRFNGTSWAAGNSIPNLTLLVGASGAIKPMSGVSLASDGTNVWAWAIDSSGNVSYCKWNGTSWGSWTVQEATRTNALGAGYVTACYSSAASGILVAWTEHNGSYYEITCSFLSTGGASPSTGTGAATLAALTAAGTGGFVAPGVGAATLATLVGAGIGGFVAPGVGTATLAALTGSGSGGFVAPGTGAATLAALTGAGTGGFVAPGTGAPTLAALLASGSGIASAPGTSTGVGVATITALVGAGLGSFSTTASGATTLAALTGAGAAGFLTTATGSATLAALTAAGSGIASAPGTSTGVGTASLAALTAAGTGGFATSGIGSVVLVALAATGTGGFLTTGAGSVTLAALTASGAGSAGIAQSTGTGSVILAALTASGSGGFGTTGVGAATLAALIAAGLSGVSPLYLPYEFTSVVISTANANPFGIDPEQTVPVPTENDTLDDPFGIDPEQTVLITSGLTAAD